MTAAWIALLPDRGVVGVTGPDAAAWLDNLVTNDLEGMTIGEARFAGLLTPQGKILFDFFVVLTPAGFLLETELDKTAGLAQRLGLYKLRSKVEIKDAAGEVIVASSQGDVRARPPGAISFVDPREAHMGDRVLIPGPMVGETLAQMGAARGAPEMYHRLRIAHGVAEGGQDYAYGDTFPHEANFDLMHGVSFTKGCFVGQEVVSRMQNKTVVRKRVVRISGAGALASGADITVGPAVIGKVGSVAGTEALAMLRLDRVLEARDKGQALLAGDVPITVDPAALTRYQDSVAERAAQPQL
jgi:folate-binding protein YgfZ